MLCYAMLRYAMLLGYKNLYYEMTVLPKAMQSNAILHRNTFKKSKLTWKHKSPQRSQTNPEQK